MPYHIPTIVEKVGNETKYFDLFSRLLQDRIVMLDTEVSDEVASSLIGQFLFLDNISNEPIKMYINSPGGVITAGLAIFDVMNFITSPVYTITIGEAASMGSFLLAAGEKGHRYSLPNTRIMLHQPSGRAGGQASDINITAKEILYLKDKINTFYSEFSCTGITKDEFEKLLDRDYYISPEEAIKLGLVDKIISKR